MRVSLSSIVIVALLSSIPFASIVGSYPITKYIDIAETSKRSFPRPPSPNPFRDPSPPLSNPFRDPSPPLPGSPASPAAAWRGFANDDPRFANPGQEGVRAKGAEHLQELEQAILHRYDGKNPQSVKESGYDGQGKFDHPPQLKLGGSKNPYDEFGINLRVNWHGDEITKPGSGTILKTYENTDQKAMIISKSWNKIEDPGGKLAWSDMVMSNWREAAASHSIAVSDLKYIIRDNIQSRTTRTSDGTLDLNTVDAMKGTFEAMKVDKANTLSLDFKTTDKTMLQQVWIMSAQTHIARVLQMLKDYRREFEDLRISKIHLQTNENPKSDFQYNIIIELGR